jgi:hypothetical protein
MVDIKNNLTFLIRLDSLTNYVIMLIFPFEYVIADLTFSIFFQEYGNFI